jgi:hypothetical protein
LPSQTLTKFKGPENHTAAWEIGSNRQNP